jgi:IS4 transposase
MPAIRRGKTGGINQFLKGKSSYKTTYTMSKGKDNDVTFNLWIVCKYKKGKKGKYGVEYFAYVIYKTKINLSFIHQDYRRRFGIESSYRLKNICRIRTNNKKPVLRLLFIGISFILVNIWVYLLWFKISRKRKGRRLIYCQFFGLKQMLAFLRQVVERKYKTVESIYIPSG